MGFWDRIKKDLQIAMKEGVDLLKEGTTTLATGARRMAKKGATTVRAETQRLTRLSRLRYELFRLNQKAKDKLTEIGGQVYDLASENLNGFELNDKARKLIVEAKKIEERTKELKAQIQELSGRK